MMKRIRYSMALVVAILALTLGRASAFNMVPPSTLGGTPGVGAVAQCPALANIVAGTNGLWSITDAQCFRGLLLSGWSTRAVPQVLTPASTVNIDLSKGCNGSIAFPAAGQNVTLTATNIPFCTGQDVKIYTTQPASGTTNNTVTFSTGFTANATIPAVKTGTSATDVVAFGDNGTLVEYPLVGSGAAGSSTTPSFSTVTATGTGDLVIAATNGGHISSQKGTASLPTVGTGTVTAGGTDNAMIVTGATSPVTVTFATAFAAVPICVCSDITSALGACKVVGGGGGASAVVTTTATDSFNLICVGK